MRHGLWMAVLWAACSGDEGTFTPYTGADPRDQNDEEEYPYFPATQVYLNAEIAYNGVRQLTADIDGSSAPPMIYFTLATPEWDGTSADVAQYCLVGVPLVAAFPYNEVIDPDQDIWFAYQWNPVDDPAITTCNTEGFELDPDIWGTDPIALFTANTNHFVAVGEMSFQTQEVILNQPVELDPVGGAFGLPPLLQSRQPGALRPTVLNFVYALPFATDPSGRLLIGSEGLVEVPSADLRADPTIPTFYNMASLVYWEL